LSHTFHHIPLQEINQQELHNKAPRTYLRNTHKLYSRLQ
jgi:hypothetical protein